VKGGGKWNAVVVEGRSGSKRGKERQKASPWRTGVIRIARSKNYRFLHINTQSSLCSDGKRAESFL
jgi:hypothetical protein